MRTMVLSILAVCLLSSAAGAGTRTVPDDYPSIQSAIDASHDGDVVLVLPGMYLETINFKGKNITVTGADPNDAGVVGYTIISADGKGSAVTFESGETSKAVLTGFTITKGIGTLYSAISSTTEMIYMGGGICCNNSAPTITKNVIVRNTGILSVDSTGTNVSLCFGGGIGGFNCNATITRNVIRTNSAYAGGGIIAYLGSPTISDNIIFDNAAYVGGGLVTFAGSVYNNTIVHNSCDYGQELGLTGGMGGNYYLIFEPTYGATAAFNNILCSATSGNGIYWEGDISTGTFAFNDVWGNLPANYTSGDQTNMAGNISADPLFVSVSSRDYHLALESPCINAGDPGFTPPAGEMDIDGDNRVFAARVDMGADEYVGYVKPVAVAGLDVHVLSPLTAVQLDGTGSFFYDPSAATSFKWRQVSGPAGSFDDPNTAKPVFTPQSEGTYVLELVVADDRYSSTPDQLVVFVGSNRAPVADAGPDKACSTPGFVRLDGSRSSDPDPVDHLNYSWTQIAGPAVALENAATASPMFAAVPGAQYTFELVVNDGFVSSAPSRVTITGVETSLGYRYVSAYTTNYDYCNYPDISGTRAVFATGSGTVYTWRITWIDLMSQETETFALGGISTQPRIDGDLVVWSGGPSSPSTNGLECTSVFLRNIATATQTALRTYSNTQSFSHPAVSGHTVVWVQHSGIDKTTPAKWLNTSYDICGADVTDMQHPVYFTIAEKVGKRDPFPYQNPTADIDRVLDISGKIVVWEGDGDIYAADISDLSNIKIFPVCTAPGRQFSPAVSGNYVVWTDQRDDDGDIYGADISDPQHVRVFEVAKATGVQQQPSIDGCLVAYLQGKSTGQIRMTCITARYGLLDVDLPAFNGICPAVDGTMLLYLSSASGYGQAYRMGIGYSAFDGRIQNKTTGRFYDYIQHAVACASSGNEIVVPAGIYPEQVQFLGKPLTVRSADPSNTDVVAATMLSGSGNLVTFEEGETNASVLDGFTMTGGYQGIFCGAASPTIRNCVITGQSGAGVRMVNQSKPALTRCRVVGNAGDGIDMHSNTTSRSQAYSVPVLTNCIIAGNSLIGVRAGQPTITNCTIVENFKDGVNSTAAAVTNSIIFSNGGAEIVVTARSTVAYSDVEGGMTGAGNINADPQFVAPGRWTGTVWTEGDYHLKSQGWRWDAKTTSWTSDNVTSPCIDAGNPQSSLADEPVKIPRVASDAVVNTAIDMGAYGGTSQASVKRANP